MIKISANLCKKVPIPGMEFSSQSFMAGIEVEVSDGTSVENIRARVKEVYGLLEQSINEQLESHAAQKGDGRVERTAYVPGSIADSRKSSPRPGKGGATQAQVKAIFAIARALGVDRNGLQRWLVDKHGVQTPEDLSVKQASLFIEELKSRQAAA